ncbi:MAG TPA: hypothetical protein PLV51_06990 [Lentimicrobium sp.]|nr:hypothetical protein [Lentimicrobium sp.]
MKKKSYLVLVLIVFLSQTVTAQDNCKVLLPALSGEYTGGCKKGLADGRGTAKGTDHYTGQFKKGLPDGKGIYTWETGEIYDGSWKNGMRHGIGTYTWFSQGQDTVMHGQWNEDQYTGPVIPKPRITQNNNVERYTIRKENMNTNRVLLSFLQNGLPNGTITNLMLACSSGYETSLGPLTGFEGVTFPLTVSVRYTTMNKLKTATFDVRFEVEIYEAGDWRIVLYN